MPPFAAHIRYTRRADLPPWGPVSVEILDLRHFASPDLRSLVDEEVGVWRKTLHWDYRASADLVLRYVDSRILPGFAAIERGRAVKDLGVAALQVTPPHYIFRPDDDALLRHYEALARGTGMSIIIYNVVPSVYLPPQLLTRIITGVEGVIGVKQSAGDLKLLADLLLMLGNRGRIMSATDAVLYPSFVLGAHGAIAAILAAAPTLCVQLWNAVQAGNYKTALGIHEKLLPIWNAIWGDNLPANVKCAEELQGRKAGLPRAPMPASSESQKSQIRKALKNGGLI